MREEWRSRIQHLDADRPDMFHDMVDSGYGGPGFYFWDPTRSFCDGPWPTEERAVEEMLKSEGRCGKPDCAVSTGICGRLTFGRGDLDANGYWSEPCGICARRSERLHPEDGPCWPGESENGT